MKTLLTVDELNEVQREWMTLDCNAPEKEKQRVFSLMKQYPKAYASGHDGNYVVMVNEQPMSAYPRPAKEAIDWLSKYSQNHSGVRFDVAWNGKIGKWEAIQTWLAVETRDDINEGMQISIDKLRAAITKAESK